MKTVLVKFFLKFNLGISKKNANLLHRGFVVSKIVAAALFFCFVASGAEAAINTKINYQGKLTDSSGVAVTDGAYDLVFKFYTAAGGGGSAIWTESWTNAALFTDSGTTYTAGGCASGIDKIQYTSQTNESSLAAGQLLWNTTKKESAVIESVVTGSDYICVYSAPTTWTNGDNVTNRVYVKNGLFSVMMGGVQSLAGVDFNQLTYLGVTVGADSEMKPRKMIGAVPGAFESKQLDGYTWAVPGTIGATTPNSGAFTILSSNYSGVSTALTVNQSGAGFLEDIQKSGVSKFLIDNNGNVGIGTTSPASKLAVYSGDNKDTGPIINLGGSGVNQFESGRLRFTETNMGVTPWYQGAFIHYDGSANTFNIGVHNAADAVQASDSNAISILRSNGYVGISNISPGALIDIGTAGTVLGTMRLEGNTSGYVQIQPAAAAGSWTMTLPATGGTSNYFLQTNGSGVTTWASAVTAETDPIVKAINGMVKSNGTTISAAASGTDYSAGTASLATGILKSTTTTGALSIAAGSDLNSTFGSQTANYIYAAPNGSAGNPSFRAIVDADVPDTITITNLSQITNRDHGSLSGLSDDDHTIYSLLAGRSGGQTLIGGTTATDDLILRTTAGTGASGADMIFQTGTNGGTEAMRILYNGNVGIGTAAPGTKLDVAGNILLQANGTIDTRAAGTLAIGGATQTGLTLGRSGQSTTLAGNVQGFTLAGNITGSGSPTITGLGQLTVDNLQFDGTTINATNSASLNIFDNASRGITIYNGGSIGVTDSVTFGKYIPAYITDTTTAPVQLSKLNMLRRGAIDSFFPLSGQKDHLYQADKQSQYTITDNIGSCPSCLFNNNLASNDLVPVASLPWVLTINSTSAIEYTDVLYLLIVPHVQSSSGFTLTNWTVEYKDSVGTWKTVLNRSGVTDNGIMGVPIYYKTGAPSYEQIYGIRITINSGTGSSWDSNNMYFSRIGLINTRPTGTPAESIGALDTQGGTVFGSTYLASYSGNVGIGTTSAGAKLDIGSAGTTLGTMRLEGNTSGYLQIQPAAAAGSWTMTLPATGGTSNYFLQTNGSGVTTWASAVTAETDPIVKAINGMVKSNGTTISAAASGTDYSAGTASLATGILKSTTTTGALSIAAGSDLNSTFGSQTANYIYAAPNGSAGNPSFRAIVDADVPDTITITNLSQITNRDHGSLSGLSDDDHTIYSLLAGRSGGQTLIGGTAATDDLILRTTAGTGASGADMIFQTGTNGGTEAMRILYNGNVGVGTTAPSVPLEVTGNANFNGNRINIGGSAQSSSFHGSYNGMMLRPTDGTRSVFEIHSPADTGKAVLQVLDGTGGFYIQSLTSAPTIFNNNYVGSYLRVDGSALDRGIKFSSTGATTNVGLGLVGNSLQVTDGSTGFGTLSAGNVGIGTTAPGALLDLGFAGTTLGTMRLEGNTSGYVQIQPAAAAGSWTMTLPATGGTSNYFLQTNGSGVTTWASAVTAETDPIVKAINGMVKSNGTTISAATSGTDYSAGTASLATGILKSTTTTGALSIAAGSDLNSTFGSQTANYIYAAPNGSAGNPSFRAIVDADVPDTITITNLSQITNRDHGSLSGLSDDDHTIYSLLAGRSGGQTLIGGTGATDSLILRTTAGTGASGADMIFQTGTNGGTEAMRILYDGKVGIGTTAPTSKLDVYDSVNNTTAIKVQNPTNNSSSSAVYQAIAATATGFWAVYPANYSDVPAWADRANFIADTNASGLNFVARAATGDMRFITGGDQTERMRIDSAGNVGIGTTSPGVKLVVGQPSANIDGSTGHFAAFQDRIGAYTSTGIGASMGNTGGDYGALYAYDYGNYLAKNLILNEYGGNVGIGTTSPSARFTVKEASSNLSYGANLITNGDFSQGNTGWTVGAGWSTASGAAVHTAGNNNLLTQNFSVTAGSIYRIQFTVSGMTAGELYASDDLVYLDLYNIAVFADGNGNYSLDVYAPTTTTDTLYFGFLNNSFNGAVDNVTVRQVTTSAPSSSMLTLLNNDGTTGLEIRPGGNGLSNVAIGEGAFKLNIGGDWDTAVGKNALAANTLGSSNSAFGTGSLTSNTLGINNSAFGILSLGENISGAFNSAFGSGALNSNTIGNNNIAIGYNAGDALTTGSDNIIIGYDIDLPATNSTSTLDIANLIYANGLTGSGTALSSGNVGIGITAPVQKLDVAGKIAQNGTTVAYLPDQTSFTGTLILGDGGLSLSHSASTDGRYDTFVGLGSGYSNSVGEENTAVGYRSLYTNDSGYYNTAIGYQSLYSNTQGQENTAVGKESLYSNINGYWNTASGLGSLYSNTSGSYNAGFGYYSIYNNKTGSYNTAVGLQAGNGVYNNSFSNNSLFGYRAGYGLSTGSNNIIMGYRAGDNLTTGANNILLGYDIDAQSETGSNQLSIGNLIFGTGIDGTAKTVSSGNVGIGTTSPSYKLDVNGTFNVSALSTFASGLGIKESGSTPTYYTYLTGGDQSGDITYTLPVSLPVSNRVLQSTSAGVLSWVDAGGSSQWTTTGNDIYYSTGNVGIGTTGPSRKLDILDAANPQLRLTQANGTVYSDFQTDASGTLAILPSGGNTTLGSGTEVFTVLSTGNVGIGTTTPSAKLHIYESSAGSANVKIESSANSASNLTFATNGTNKFLVGSVGDGSYFRIFSYGAGGQSVAVMADGKVGIGTTAPGALLDVQSAATTDTAANITANSLTSGNGLTIGSTAAGLTGNALSVTTASTGVPTAGLVRFNFNGTRTAAGNGFQIDDISTTLATVMAINANSLTTGTGQAQSYNALSTGKGLTISSSSTGITTAGANVGSLFNVNTNGAITGFTGSLANISMAGASNSGNTGSLLNINDAGAANLTKLLTMNSSSTSNTAALMSLTSATTAAAANGLVRFNFNAAHTGNGFQIDDLTATGIAMALNANSVTTGNALSIAGNALTTGNLVNITSTSTGAASNAQTLLNLALSGTNGTSAQTTYGLQVANTHAGTTSTNVAGYFSATGGTTANYGLLVANGSVGIGTTIPGVKFDIYGGAANVAQRILSGGAAQWAAIQWGRTATDGTIAVAGAAGQYLTDAVQGDTVIRTETTGAKLLLGTGASATTMTINNGNVGIGTTAPGAKLTINSNTATLPAQPTGTILNIANADAAESIFNLDAFASNGKINFRRSGNTAASPTAVQSGDTLGLIQFTGYGATGYLTSSAAKIAAIATEAWTDSTAAAGLVFSTRPSSSIAASLERMRIDKDGNVGIGTTAPGKLLDVLQAASNSQVRISQSNSVYSEFYVDSAGDLRISATGGDIRALDENLWVCSGGACPSITPSGNGNLIVEGGITIGTSSATCDANNRGTTRVAQGGAGTADLLYTCLKTSSDTYQWVLVARGN